MSEVIKPQDTLKERATELFGLCDQDRKGFITRNDLVQVLTELDLPLETKQVEQAFAKLDNDQNGYLTLEEFTEGFGLFLGIDINDLNDNTTELDEIATSDPGRELFYLCDTDRKGYITKPDLQRVSCELNLNFDQLDLIFDKLDQDSNGRLTLDEFADGFGAYLRDGTGAEETNEVPEQVDGIEVEAFDQPRDVFESVSTDDSSSNTKEDAVFREVVESIGEDVLSGALSKEQLRELWESLQHNDSRAIHKFEDFLSKVSSEIKRARNDTTQLENALKSKMNSHDREVQKLYEEMEQQIKAVKDRYETEHEKREKAIKGQLMSELERKEMEIQWMLNKQKKLEEKIAQNEKHQMEIRTENEMLLQKNLSLEDQLTDSVMSLEDTRNYVQHLQTTTAEEKEERARHAIKMTEGMQLEQESLIQQLDLLRDVNQKLRDDRDSIEAAHKAMLMTKHKKVNRQGSKMSKYISGSDSEKHRSFGSINEEDSQNTRSSTDSLHSGFPMGLSINQEVEFEGDVELGKIADEKPATPGWASNIMAAYKKVEDEKKKKGEQEIDDFRKRKSELLTSVEERNSEDEEPANLSDAFYSSEENSGSDSRPRSPRTAPIGKDDESFHAESASTISLEPVVPVRVFKVVIVGDSGVGKSSFLHRFCHDQWKPSFTATIGVDFQIKTLIVNNRCIAIQLWDTAGQERFRSITKQYFRKADGILVFYDVTAETSYLNLKSWMTSVDECAEEHAAIMVVGNKVDLAEDSKTRVVKTEDAEMLAKCYNALYMETSAKSGHNINEVMIKLAEVLQDREDEMMNSVLNLVHVPSSKKKGCCKKS